MQAVKRNWVRFRSLPMVVQVVTWVVIGFLVVGLFSGSQEPDTETSATRGSTTTEGATTTDTEARTTSSTTSTTTAATATTSATTAEPAGDVVSVTRIVDGDTMAVSSGETVRLIGIDTPETKHPSQPVECFGAQATQHATELMGPGTSVRLVYDVERTDRYGRTLAYVYRDSDDLFVNLQMVRDGFAAMATYPPNVAHVEAFRAAEQEARSANRGLWGGCGGADTPAGGRVHPRHRRLHPLPAEAAGTATARTSPPTKRPSGSTRPRAVPARTRTASTETAMASPARACRESLASRRYVNRSVLRRRSEDRERTPPANQFRAWRRG